jgi:hypothetical protein
MLSGALSGVYTVLGRRLPRRHPPREEALRALQEPPEYLAATVAAMPTHDAFLRGLPGRRTAARPSLHLELDCFPLLVSHHDQIDIRAAAVWYIC